RAARRRTTELAGRQQATCSPVKYGGRSPATTSSTGAAFRPELAGPLHLRSGDRQLAAPGPPDCVRCGRSPSGGRTPGNRLPPLPRTRGTSHGPKAAMVDLLLECAHHKKTGLILEYSITRSFPAFPCCVKTPAVFRCPCSFARTWLASCR